MRQEINTPRPIIKAASACVWRRDEVLFVQRGKAFGRGTWALPGGKIESGETAVEAALRELLEETGVSAGLERHVGDFDLAGPGVHYVISCWTGHYLSGTAMAQSDVMAVKWLDFRAIATLNLVAGNAEAVLRARQLLTD
jgi:ADP-ribose pyrophosphatase YjhB (NUDIX family)